jgi:hypothetical protein
VAKHDVTRLVDVLVEAQCPPRFAEELSESPLALLHWVVAQIVAAELKEIKGEQHSLGLLPPVSQSVEDGNAVLATDDHFAVDQAGAAGERRDGSGDRGIAVCPIQTAAGEKPHAGGVPARQQPKTVVLDLMDPAPAGGRLQGWAGLARFDETVQARRRDTQQHSPLRWTALAGESSRMLFAARRRAPPARAVSSWPRLAKGHVRYGCARDDARTTGTARHKCADRQRAVALALPQRESLASTIS